MAATTTALKPVDKLKRILSADSVQEQFKNSLQDNAPLFTASLIDIYASDGYLQKCDAQAVVMEALKAATLKLPINKSLGFAYIVPYGNEPQMQIGYKGYIQLAMRTGRYKYLNADKVYEGELKKTNKLTGELDLSGDRTSDKVVGYFAYMETVNGFSKTIYWSKEQVLAHAKRYSKSFTGPKKEKSPWTTNFDEMAIKTVIRNLLAHYGIMSVEMMSAYTADDRDFEEKVQDDIDLNANSGPVIDITINEPAAAPAETTQANESAPAMPDWMS